MEEVLPVFCLLVNGGNLGPNEAARLRLNELGRSGLGSPTGQAKKGKFFLLPGGGEK